MGLFFSVFRLMVSFLGTVLVFRYWYWDGIGKWYIDPLLSVPNLSFLSTLRLIILIISWLVLLPGFMMISSRRWFRLSTWISAIALCIILVWDHDAYSVHLGLLTLITWALLTAKTSDSPSKLTIFLIRIIYSGSMVFLGIEHLTNSGWKSAIQWENLVQLLHVGNRLLEQWLMLPAFKWNAILVMPFLELTAVFLIRKHRLTYVHFACLAGYHLFVFLIFTSLFPDQGATWMPLLQGACLLLMLPISQIEEIELKRIRFQEKYRAHQNKKILSKRNLTMHPNWTIAALGLFLGIQIILPIWPYFFSENLHWTSRGTLFAWRMKLNRMDVDIKFLVDQPHQETKIYRIKDFFVSHSGLKYHPYVIWKCAQFLSEKAKNEGSQVTVHVLAYQSLNGSQFYSYINPNVDISKEQFHYFGPNHWVLPMPAEGKQNND